MFGTYAGGNRMLIRTTFGRPLRAIADDLSLTPELVTTGEYDRPFLNFLERTLHYGDVAVDVGANIGLFTVRMGELVGPNGRVFAYEPHPEVHSVLVENIELNYMTWVTPSTIAADATDGVAVLHVTSRFHGNSSLTGKPEQYRSEATTDEISEAEVETARLDRVLANVGEIHLVKIDVEGAERRVLEGLEGLIGANAVRMVDLEMKAELTPDWEQLLDDVALLVQRHGASLSTIAADGTLQATDIDEIRRVARFPHVVVTLPRSS